MSGDHGPAIIGTYPLLTAVAIACALIAAGLLLWYLLRRPPLTGATKVLLFLGFGVFPIGAAMTGNMISFEHSTNRGFCGSCHVMVPYTSDSADPSSTTLASRHARNELFGGQNCYECHRDYGMFSTLLTKWGGMAHVWYYYTEYHDVPVEQALETIELYRPYRNANCIRCHSTETSGWMDVGEHRAMARRIRAGDVSCAARGCHGPAHPFSKPARESAPNTAARSQEPLP